MLVVATAGHVDHGKSTLVRALTGMEPDRWAEERRRGMTIDLGYAWTDELTFVDVPGHERFLANMLAGIGPVPAALLVVAADAGWSAQTEEHWQALRMLDVRHGLVAVSRSDLAPPHDVGADAARRTHWPVQHVSAATGRGIEELRAALSELASRAGVAPDSGRPRLWVDRAFSLPGAGPVVTGTLAEGSLAPGDQVVVGGRRARVTGVQSRGEEQAAGLPGCRVALRLRGVRRDDLARGMTVTRAGDWWPAQHWDVALTAPGPVPDVAVLHVGSAAVTVRLRRLDDEHVRLFAAEELLLKVGDRGLLRDSGGRGLLTGVTVLEPDPPPLERRRGAALARAAHLRSSTILERRAHVDAATLRAFGLDAGAHAGCTRTLVIDRIHHPVPPTAAPDHVDDPVAAAEATLRRLRAPFTLAEARDALALSRSATLVLLASLDQRGRTVRRADGTRAWVRPETAQASKVVAK